MESGILVKNLESLIKWDLDKSLISYNYTVYYPQCDLAYYTVLFTSLEASPYERQYST